MSIRTRPNSVLPWLMLSLLALPLVAQEASQGTAAETAEAAVPTSEEAEGLLQKLQGTDAELSKIVEALKTAEGEDSLLLRNQFDELSESEYADLDRLTKIIAGRDKGGSDVTQLQLQTEVLLKRASRRLRNSIRTYEADLGERAAQRETLTPDEIEVFEHQMAMNTNRLNHLYLDLIKLSQSMAAAGLPVDDETEFLQVRLKDRAQHLIGVLELTTKQLDQFQQMAKRAPDNTAVQSQLFAAEERYDSNKASLSSTIHMMKTLGFDYADIEVRALEITGEITPEAFQVEVGKELAENKFRQAKNYLFDGGPKLFFRLLVIIGILAAFWILARLSRGFVSRILNRSSLSPSELLKETIITWTGRLIMLAALMMVLSQLGIDLGPVLAGLGIAGFIVGFALQDTLGNFAAGAMILFYQPYDVGDFIEAAGITGKVRDMNLVSTRILTPDHQTLIVPNSKIWGDVIRNVTAQPTRRVDLVFGISYEDDIAKAESVLADIVANNDMVLDDPEPVIKLHTLNDSSVDFVVRPWAKTDDYWDVHWDITRAVKVRFDEEGISIPYPQRDVHLIPAENDAAAGVTGSEPEST